MAVCGVRYGCVCGVRYVKHSHMVSYEWLHFSQVGLTQDDSLYILVGVVSYMPTAFLEYTMEELTQREVYGERAGEEGGGGKV